MGERELQPTQIAAAKLLLDRTLPVMSAVDPNGQAVGNGNVVVIFGDQRQGDTIEHEALPHGD